MEERKWIKRGKLIHLVRESIENRNAILESIENVLTTKLLFIHSQNIFICFRFFSYLDEKFIYGEQRHIKSENNKKQIYMFSTQMNGNFITSSRSLYYV